MTEATTQRCMNSINSTTAAQILINPERAAKFSHAVWDTCSTRCRSMQRLYSLVWMSCAQTSPQRSVLGWTPQLDHFFGSYYDHSARPRRPPGLLRVIKAVILRWKSLCSHNFDRGCQKERKILRCRFLLSKVANVETTAGGSSVSALAISRSRSAPVGHATFWARLIYIT